MEFSKRYEKFMKINPSEALKQFDIDGSLKKYIPEIDELKECKLFSSKHDKDNVFGHILTATQIANNQSMERINAITLHDIGKLVTCKGYKYPKHDIKGVPIAEEILTSLGRPDKEIDISLFCIRNHMRIHDILYEKPLKRLELYKSPYFDDLCFTYQADTYNRPKKCNVPEIINDRNNLLKNEIELLLEETDFHKLGIPLSEMKAAQNDILQRQLMGKISNKAQAISFINKKYVKWNFAEIRQVA